jgi:hypothetical protein
MTDPNRDPPTEPHRGLRLVRTDNLELRKQVFAFEAALRIIRNGVDNPSEFAAAVLEQWGMRDG